MSTILNEDSLYETGNDEYLLNKETKQDNNQSASKGLVSGLMNWREHAMNDLLASIVVFLVALPLCMGIAIASGVPPAVGLITGIVGGIIVGIFAGSPLLVSGPAAGLAVIIWELVQNHGIAVLGPIVLMAGIIQVIAGSFKMGQWFRAVSPAVIHGMLAGIGVTILANQAFVMIDSNPMGNGVKNLLLFPAEVEHIFESLQGLTIEQMLQPINDSSSHLALGIGALTLLIMISWTSLAPKKLRLIPAPLVAVIIASAVAVGLQLPINYVEVPSNLLDVIQLPTLTEITHLFDGPIFTAALAVAFIASAETLLSAAAVDRMHNGVRTRYDKELFAQGLGNTLCGFLGVLPMTGVIARSGANVEAGAKTRASTIIHGFWLLLFIAMLPFVLHNVPIASLAAVLIVIGSKLIKPSDIRKLREFGKGEMYIYFVTLGTIVATNLLDGVLIGIGLAFGKIVYSMIHLEARLGINADRKIAVLKLDGAATFIQLPKLAGILEKVPDDIELHVNIEELTHIDPACLELFENWAEEHRATGGSVVLEWNKLMGKYGNKQRSKLTVAKSVNPGKELSVAES